MKLKGIKIIKFKDGTTWILKCPICGGFNISGEQYKQCENCGWGVSDYRIVYYYKTYELNKKEQKYFDKLIDNYGKGKFDNVSEKLYNYLMNHTQEIGRRKK